MATTNILLLLLVILTNTFLSTTIATTTNTNTTLISTILTTLGFTDLSSAAANLSITTPSTIFAPSDSSLRTCQSCSVPLILQEHTLPGLYPLHFLRNLAFGTKIGTFSPNRCLTVTSSTNYAAASTKKVFINGVEINKPDMFNNGVLIVHSLQGFISHLSPRSCFVEGLTTLSFPQQLLPTAAFFTMRLMLKDAMRRLRGSGYSIVALAMRVKYPELSELKSMTLFAVDDESIFAGGEGHAYVAELGFHIVPNRILMGADLVKLASGTVLPTMMRGRSVVVTNAGDGGPLTPVRINYVRVKRFDVVHNDRIVVHGLSTAFRHVEHPVDLVGDSRFGVAPSVGSYGTSTIVDQDDAPSF